MEFADGSLIFLIALAIGFVGVVIGYFTVSGSGINPRPYGKVYGGAPGARGASDASGKDHGQYMNWSRGTK